MSTRSGIAWTDTTWSPVTGCTKVSAGCKNCYAEREVVGRWSKNPKSVFYGRDFTDVRCHHEKLEQPLHWKKPRKIFVCPRGDLFHQGVQDVFIDRVFAVMALCPQHTFQVLTKRPDRMLLYLTNSRVSDRIWGVALEIAKGRVCPESDPGWPIENVWLGVSVEDQAAADKRIPLLLRTPAAVRWISAEPLLGSLDVSRWINPTGVTCPDICPDTRHIADGYAGIDWVVAGGESGSKARPMHPEWAHGLRDQCSVASVPFLFKQHGEFLGGMGITNEQTDASKSGGWVSLDGAYHDGNNRSVFREGDAHVYRCGTKTAGRLLDGQEWNQYPTN